MKRERRLAVSKMVVVGLEAASCKVKKKGRKTRRAKLGKATDLSGQRGRSLSRKTKKAIAILPMY